MLTFFKKRRAYHGHIMKVMHAYQAAVQMIFPSEQLTNAPNPSKTTRLDQHDCKPDLISIFQQGRACIVMFLTHNSVYVQVYVSPIS